MTEHKGEEVADLRLEVLRWADEQMQALPEHRTPVAHGKAELLTDLRRLLAEPVFRPGMSVGDEQ